MTAAALRLFPMLSAVVAVAMLAACGRDESGRVQGYVEGEFIYIASPYAGALETLAVQRGAQVKTGDLLFSLESGAEKAVRDEAERKVTQSRATLEDVKKGKRPMEIESMEAQLQQARAALVLAEKELLRQQELYKSGASAAQDLDRARSTRDQDRQRVSQLEADLATARLGSRDDQIAAAEAALKAQEAALAKADWDLAQKRQSAPVDGLVFDTLYQQGEWVAAGRPVVVLLPPSNIKVRAFVAEAKVGAIHPGDAVRVSVDGAGDTFAGKVTYISPQAEYTPPVIYSRETRTKLVFMVEARFDSATAVKLHPGQPVDVEFTR